MCFLWRNEETNLKRPGLKEWKEFIVSLGGFSNSGFNVIFGGGEPLLFPDTLTELIAFCRGMPDSYERLLQAITYLNNFHSPLEIAIDTLIMAPNLRELLELANWVRQDNRIHSIFFQAVVQPFHSHPIEDWYKTEEYNFLWPKDMNEVDFLIDELIKLKDDSLGGKRDKINNPISQFKLFKSYFRTPQDFIKRYSCNVTNGDAFTVSPNGSVNLCPYMKPIGNIQDGDIKDIWYSQEAKQRRQ
jgi:MoaA/NifB/PqqE/SkfB family radical SAM enzyme